MYDIMNEMKMKGKILTTASGISRGTGVPPPFNVNKTLNPFFFGSGPFLTLNNPSYLHL